MDSKPPDGNENRLERINRELKERQERGEAQQREMEQAIRDIREIANTEAGVRWFRWFAKKCGHNKDPLIVNAQTGEVCTSGVMHDVARARVYLQIRQMFTEEQQIEIEIRKPRKETAEISIQSTNEVRG